MWAVYERGHIAHHGNHTNNRPEMELDECVETLNFSQPTAELEYASRFTWTDRVITSVPTTFCSG
ncbi:hypothetical protein GQ600_6181 [Phytophthora cactorum]|nr:hypothetical protein GQ600_6181 [Phytophthora cactorum]